MNRMQILMTGEPAPAGGTPVPEAAPTTTDPKAAPAAPDPKTTQDPKQTVLTEKPPADPKAPTTEEEISIKLPEGVQFEEGRMAQFTKLAKEIGLKGEGAQKMADFYVEMRQAEEVANAERIVKWAEEARADKEIGGANWDPTVKAAKLALDRLATPELRRILSDSGFGNHAEFIRLFAKIGKVIPEDRLPRDDRSTETAEPSYDQMLREAFPNSPGMFQGKR